MSLGSYLTRILMPSSAWSGSVQRIAMWADGIYYIVVISVTMGRVGGSLLSLWYEVM
jgi:hypothetical protein